MAPQKSQGLLRLLFLMANFGEEGFVMGSGE
jgi:hypothetical protein